jgi:hypothetical protein
MVFVTGSLLSSAELDVALFVLSVAPVATPTVQAPAQCSRHKHEKHAKHQQLRMRQLKLEFEAST